MLGLLLLVAYLWFGVCVVRVFRVAGPAHVRWVIAAAVGFVGGSWVIYGLHRVFGGFTAGLWLSAVGVLLIFSVGAIFRGAEMPAVPDRWFLGVVAASALAFAWLHAVGTLSVDADGNWRAVEHVWADAPFHASLITSFASRPMAPPMYPIALGVPLRYPFMVDFFTASVMGAGAGLRLAFVSVNVLMGVMVIAGISALTERITGSVRGAVAAAGVFFFLGNFGFLALPGDIAKAGGFTAWARDLPWSYTGDALGGPGRERLGVGLYMGNPVFMFVDPRRSGAFGLAGGFGALLLIDELRRRPRLLVGLLTGAMIAALVRVHVHSAVVVAIAAVAWGLPSLKTHMRVWVTAGAIAAALVALQLPSVLGHTPGFAAIQPGWTAEPKDAIANIDGLGTFVNALFTFSWFWILNLGALVIGFVVALRRAHLRRFLIPFALVFLFANLVRTQPLDWDNSPWFVWIQIAGVVVTADLLRRLIGPARFQAVTLTIALTLGGVLSFVYGYQDPFHLWSRSDRAVAEGVRDNTGIDAVVLTSGNDAHGHSVNALSGRQVVSGWLGWLMAHGLDWAYFDQAVTRMYTGDYEYACELGVTHVVSSAYERNWASSKGINLSFSGLRRVAGGPGWDLYATNCK